MKPVVVLLCLGLAACDQIAELDGSKAAEADGKAVGGACRHAGRALEDCYTLYEAAPKAAVFTGWREMNDYMTQNKIDVVPPVIPKKVASKGGKGEKGEKGDKAEVGGAGKGEGQTGKYAPLPDPLAPKAAGSAKEGETKEAAKPDAKTDLAASLGLPPGALNPVVQKPAEKAAPH